MIIGTNFKLSSKKYLDNRQQCASLNDLIINKDSILYPQGFEVYCIKEKAWYQNVSEGDTPEWKIRQSGTSEGGASIDDTKISATTTWSSEYIYDMKLELQDLITQTEDYVAEIDDRLLYVEGRLTSIGSFDGSYDSLTNKPEFPSLQGYATHEYVDEVIANIGKIEGTKDYNELINQPINNVAIEYIIDGRLIVNVDYLKVGKWYIVNTDLNEEYNSATSFSLVYYLSSDSYSIINTFENEDMHSLIYVSSEDEKEIKIKYITVNGETYELIYNKETNEKTLNLLSSSGNGNGGFSGDYNDLENRPCYEDEGDIPEYLNIEIYSDTDFSNKESIEIINGTADNGNCITYRKYVKLFSDITIDMINTMKEYGVFISKYEGQLIENPLIDILDESQADRGMYFIGLEFEFILQATEGYYLPENGLWYMESYVDRDLNGNLIAEYKTVDDFNGILLIKDNGKLNTGTIKQLDEKFIPNTIARIEDVNILIEENGLSGDYNDLKNRPCYGDGEAKNKIIIADNINYDNSIEFGDIYLGYNNSLENRVFTKIYSGITEQDVYDIYYTGKMTYEDSEGVYEYITYEEDEYGDRILLMYKNGCYFFCPEYPYFSFIFVTTDEVAMEDGSVLSNGIWTLVVTYGGMENLESNKFPEDARFIFDTRTKKYENNDSFKQLDEKYIPNSVWDYNNLQNIPCFEKPGEIKRFANETLNNTKFGDNISEIINSLDFIEIANDLKYYKVYDEPLVTSEDEFCLNMAVFYIEDNIATEISFYNNIKSTELEYGMDSDYIEESCLDIEKFITFYDMMLFVKENNTEILLKNGLSIILNKGTYLAYTNSELAYSISVQFEPELKQLNEKFIPDTIARAEDIELLYNYTVSNYDIDKIIKDIDNI